ncbi:MAG: ATP-binding protein [Chloroflexota bacterium]
MVSLSLAGVVLCLAGFSIFAAYTTQMHVDEARQIATLQESYSKANAALLEDESAQLEALVFPSAERIAAQDQAHENVAAALREIAARGGQGEAQLVNDLLRLHEQYRDVYAVLATAAAAGDQVEVRRQDGVADGIFHIMRNRLALATEQGQVEVDSSFAALHERTRWLLILAPVVFAIGFALLLGLWRMLERHNRSTRAIYAEIEQLSKLRGEFVSVVSHEFRTPLTGIQGFSEMMRDEDLTLPEMREYAGDIHKDALRLARLISDMLDLDRFESGLTTAGHFPVDLNRILTDAAVQFRLSAASHPIVLELDERVPTLIGDPDRMTQVVTNLLSNAIKYSPSGGAVELRTTSDKAAVTLTVRDHGIGIPTEQLEKIFERYSRIETKATQSIKGTGLGLPIVRQIVNLYEGKVWATSEPGAGSVFHVRFPLPADSVAPTVGQPRLRARAA